MHNFCLIFLLFYIIGCTDSSDTYPNRQPNIIFILTDDQRWDALGYAGNELAHTPEMDRLAEDGLYFSHAMVSTPICSASRATILTGLHERTHRYDFRNTVIREDFMEQSYPVELRKAGYFTGFFGKFGVKYEHADSLFDVFESYDRNNQYRDYRGYYYKTLDGDTVHLTRYTGQKAIDFLDAVPEDKPFCLSVSFSAPHAHDGAPEQYFWQEESQEVLAEAEIPEPRLGEKKWFDQLPQSVREGFNRTRWHWRFDTPEKYQHSVKGYYRMIAGIDREIGKIRAKLEENGLADNTVIVLMGDNGYFLGERQLAGKWLMYDNSVRVPLIIYDPRNDQSGEITQLVMNVDIPPTILDLAGADLPQHWQGLSLAPFTSHVNYELDRDTVLIEHLWEFEHIPPSEGLRTDRWKYFRYVNDRKIEELYNLESDPSETNNLADQPRYRKVLESFRWRLDRMAYEYRDSSVGVPWDLEVSFESSSGISKALKESDSAFYIPEYSWKIPPGAGSQWAYQILVASDHAVIDRNVGDIWNSGKVESENFLQIPHPVGLGSGGKYFWKVRIWDEFHRLSDYSQVYTFTIAE